MRDPLTPSELLTTNATYMRGFDSGSICFVNPLNHPLPILQPGRRRFDGRRRRHTLLVILRTFHR